MAIIPRPSGQPHPHDPARPYPHDPARPYPHDPAPPYLHDPARPYPYEPVQPHHYEAGQPYTSEAGQLFISESVRRLDDRGPRHAAVDDRGAAVEDRDSFGVPSAPVDSARPPTSPVGDAWVELLAGSEPTKAQAQAGGGEWLPVADDFFRVGHDAWFKALLHPDVFRRGLSAALLAELLLSERATIHDGLLRPLPGEHLDDPLATEVLRRVDAERQDVPVRDWLAFLSAKSLFGDVYEMVAMRLVRAGQVRVEPRGLLRRSARYVPFNPNGWAWPWVRLSSALRRGDDLDQLDTVLGGLVLATDLHRQVLLGASADIETRLRRNIAAAPHPVRELVDATEKATGAGVITGA